MTKHTPGPWEPTAGQIPPESVWNEHGFARICRLSDRYDSGPLSDSTIIANAHLIADAPDLLAQLRSLCWEVEAMRLDALHPLSIQAQNARALIAKHD